MSTFERLCARVLAVMTRKFIRTRESPLAAYPATLVRLFSCKDNVFINHFVFYMFILNYLLEKLNIFIQ